MLFQMIKVENGIQEKVNVKELLEKTHGISFTNFIAIFSDSNNSKQKIIAYYRDIYFSSE